MDRTFIDEVMALREKTGCNLQDCKEAILYCQEHEGASPIGYLEIKTQAVVRGDKAKEKVLYPNGRSIK